MSDPIFVDTGALFILVDRRDPRHRLADTFLANLTRPLVTSDYVFDEALTLVRSRFGHTLARSLGERVLASEFCGIRHVEDVDRAQAWEIFCRYADQDFSFTDCTSFALMRRLGIREAFAFDHHFWTAGFIVVPGQS